MKAILAILEKLAPELFLGLFKSKKCLLTCLVLGGFAWAYQESAETLIRIALISATALVAVGYLVPQGIVDIAVAKRTGKDPDATPTAPPSEVRT